MVIHKDVRQFGVGRNERSLRAAIIFLYLKKWTWCISWLGFHLSRKTSQDVDPSWDSEATGVKVNASNTVRATEGRERGAQATSQPGTVSHCLLLMPQIMPAMD